MNANLTLAMIRIEHKLDLILASLSTRDRVLASMLEEGSGLSTYSGDVCPTCRGEIRLSADLSTETYTRTCACKLNVPIVAGISSLNKAVSAEKAATKPTHEPEEDPHVES